MSCIQTVSQQDFLFFQEKFSFSTHQVKEIRPSYLGPTSSCSDYFFEPIDDTLFSLTTEKASRLSRRFWSFDALGVSLPGEKGGLESIGESCELAFYLVDDEGCFCEEVAYDLMNRLSSQEDISSRALCRALYQMCHHQNIKKKIESLECVSSEGELLVADILKLSSEVTISKVEIRRAVVATLLAPYKQGNLGYCFAYAYGQVLRDHNIECCLDDYIDLLVSGKVVRYVNGDKVVFPGQPTLLQGRIDDSIILELGRCDLIPNKSSYDAYKVFLESLKSIGVVLRSEDLNELLKEPLRLQGPIYTSPRKLLDYFFARNPHLTSEDYDRVVNRYESYYANPLLFSWGVTLSHMAQADCESATLKSVLVEIIPYVLGMAHFEHHAECERFCYALSSYFQKNSQILYNPFMERSSFLGAFALYKNGNRDRLRINNLADFRLFLKEGITHVGKECGVSQEILMLYFSFVDSKAFTRSVLFYMRQDQEGIERTSFVNRLDMNPWRNYLGGSPFVVEKVHREIEGSIALKHLDAQTPLSLLRSLVFYIQGQKDVLKQNPYLGRALVVHSTHAFSLLLSHFCLKNCLNVEVVVKNIENFTSCDRVIFNLEMKKRLLSRLGSFVSGKCLRELEGVVMKASSSIELRSVYEDIMNVIRKFDVDLEKGGRDVEAALFQVLPDSWHESFNQRMIICFDMNWERYGGGVYWGFVRNPFNHKVELWEIDGCYEKYRYYEKIDVAQKGNWIVPEKMLRSS